MYLDSIQKAQKRTANTVSEHMKCRLIFRTDLKYEVTGIVFARLVRSVVYHRLRKHWFI